MTDKEKAIIMAYTGVCMLAGDKFQIFHKYIEDIMGRPIMTHEIGWLEDEIKEKSKADFMALCADESDSKNLNRWIPVSERLPKDGQKVLVTTRSDNILDVAIDTSIFYHASAFWKHYVMAWMPLPKPYVPQESEDK